MIYILHATITETKHEFIQLFTSIENLNIFLDNHPNVTKSEITLHDINAI